MSKEKVKEKMQDTFLSKKELWAFAIGGAGQGMIYAMMSSYISDYYVNVLQLPLMFVLLLMLLARVWDAINDPLMGIIVDKRQTKRGKMKPYILYATMPIAIFTVLMYLSPDLPKTYLIIYSAIVYVGWVCFTQWQTFPSGVFPTSLHLTQKKEARFFQSVKPLMV